MERVIGPGGPFIKASDPKGLAGWYEKYLGTACNGSTCTVWPFTAKEGSAKPGYNECSFFKSDADYFSPKRNT